jgi:hypothetical protein
MTPTYPSYFPCPLIDGYQIDVDMGAIRSKDRGKPAQRRVFSTMPHSVKCKFSLSLKEWGYWQEWITKEAKGWFTINLPSMYSFLDRARTTPHLVRTMSTISIDTKTATHVTVSVTLEVAPSMFKQQLAAT